MAKLRCSSGWETDEYLSEMLNMRYSCEKYKCSKNIPSTMQIQMWLVVI